MHIDKLTQSNEFINFLIAAKAYCSFIEDDKNENQQQFLRSLHTRLLSLYLNGLNLQTVDVVYNLEYDDLLAPEYLANTLNKLSNKLQNKYYWHVFDPSDDSNIEAVCGDLLDDLGDIYRDLKNGLLLFDKGEAGEIESAVWTFKWSFDNHWGEHCMNAIYSLHYFIPRSK